MRGSLCRRHALAIHHAPLTPNPAHVRAQTVAPALSLRHSRGLSWMSGLGDGPLSLSEFTELLPQVLARCETKHMRKCEPVKRLLQCVGFWSWLFIVCVCVGWWRASSTLPTVTTRTHTHIHAPQAAGPAQGGVGAIRVLVAG